MEKKPNNLKIWLQFCIFAVLIMNYNGLTYLKIWLKRWVFALLFLEFCRILFIVYLFPYLKGAPLSEIPLVLISGVLFDVQALAYFLAPFHLLSLVPLKTESRLREQAIRFFFILGLGLVVLLNFIDLEFFKIKTRRSGIELFYLLGDHSNPVLSYLLNYWGLLLLYLATVWAMIRFYPKQKSGPAPGGVLKPLLLFILCAGLLVLGARGSISIKPLRSFDAARFVDPQWVSACINSPTQLITSYSSSIPKEPAYMDDRRAEEILAPGQRLKPYFKNGKQVNIVLIILESIGRDYCGFLNKENRFTPFLDSLAAASLVFPHAYSSGTTSMESIPSIFASIPSLLEVPYINSNYQNNRIFGLHHYLSARKYDCSFYYGAENGSMGFDNFLRMSGKIAYYGKNEYPGPKSDYDGSWGIWDLPYLEYFASELNKKPEPFFSSVFTLTSHDPYVIPRAYRKVFTGGELPIYKAVQYTDHALRMFFRKAAQAPWFRNTVFIITADHPSHSVNEYFYTPTGKYEIPLMLYAPALIRPGSADSITASHPDLMPTVLSLAGMTEPFFAFGRNLLDSGSHRAINKDYGVAQLIEYPYCLRLYPDGRTQMHVQPKYTPNKDIRYRLSPGELRLQKEMEADLKARLQVYYRSLINNRMHLSAH